MIHARDKRDANWFWINKSLLHEYGPTLGPNGIAIYNVLACHANGESQAFPSIRFVARTLGISANTVRHYLTLLTEQGLIARHQRHSNDGDFSSYEYILLTIQEKSVLGGSTIEPPASTSAPRGAVSEPPASTSAPRVVQPVNHGGSTIDTEQELLNKKRSNKRSRAATAAPMGTEAQAFSPAFLRFWQGYPKKRAQADAWAVWQSQHLDPLEEVICASVEAHRRQDDQWRDPRFIPHPAKYLRGRRWEDELTHNASDPEGCRGGREVVL
jgi:hypothetical protein